MQLGTIYFLAQRRRSIFLGFCEAIPRWVNFIIDEIVDCGKGGPSSLHHVLLVLWFTKAKAAENKVRLLKRQQN